MDVEEHFHKGRQSQLSDKRSDKNDLDIQLFSRAMFDGPLVHWSVSRSIFLYFLSHSFEHFEENWI